MAIERPDAPRNDDEVKQRREAAQKQEAERQERARQDAELRAQQRRELRREEKQAGANRGPNEDYKTARSVATDRNETYDRRKDASDYAETIKRRQEELEERLRKQREEERRREEEARQKWAQDLKRADQGSGHRPLPPDRSDRRPDQPPPPDKRNDPPSRSR